MSIEPRNVTDKIAYYRELNDEHSVRFSRILTSLEVIRRAGLSTSEENVIADAEKRSQTSFWITKPRKR